MPDMMQAAWIDAVFARLSLAYGARFLQQYEGLQPEHVKRSWANELAGVNADGIAHALNHLHPDLPPNAMQFRYLCQGRPQVHKALPAPKANPEIAAKAIEAMKGLGKPKGDPKAWAYALRQRERNREHLSKVQREAWRAVLPEQETEKTE